MILTEAEAIERVCPYMKEGCIASDCMAWHASEAYPKFSGWTALQWEHACETYPKAFQAEDFDANDNHVRAMSDPDYAIRVQRTLSLWGYSPPRAKSGYCALMVVPRRA